MLDNNLVKITLQMEEKNIWSQHDVFIKNQRIGMVFANSMIDECPEGYDFYLYLTWVFFKEYSENDLTNLILTNESRITNLFKEKMFNEKNRDYGIYTKVIVDGKNIELKDLGNSF